MFILITSGFYLDTFHTNMHITCIKWSIHVHIVTCRMIKKKKFKYFLKHTNSINCCYKIISFISKFRKNIFNINKCENNFCMPYKVPRIRGDFMILQTRFFQHPYKYLRHQRHFFHLNNSYHMTFKCVYDRI